MIEVRNQKIIQVRNHSMFTNHLPKQKIEKNLGLYNSIVKKQLPKHWGARHAIGASSCDKPGIQEKRNKSKHFQVWKGYPLHIHTIVWRDV